MTIERNRSGRIFVQRATVISIAAVAHILRMVDSGHYGCCPLSDRHLAIAPDHDLVVRHRVAHRRTGACTVHPLGFTRALPVHQLVAQVRRELGEFEVALEAFELGKRGAAHPLT